MNGLEILLGGDLPRVIVTVAFAVLVTAAAVVFFSITLLVHHATGEYLAAQRRAQAHRAAVCLAAAIVNGAPGGFGCLLNEDPGTFFAEDLTQTAQRVRKLEGTVAVSAVLRRSRKLLRGETARRITRTLEDLGEVRRLATQATSRRKWRRATAMRQLGECGGDKARDALILATHDRSIDVRRAAREGLLIHRTSDAIVASSDSFVRDESQVLAWRKSFLTRLAEVDAPRIAELIGSGKLSDATEKLALEAMGEQRAVEAVPLAVERLHAADPEMRAAAVRTLGRLQLLGVMDPVTAKLSDPSWFVRAAAARALASVSCDEQECEVLKGSLEDEAWWVRSNAALALSRQEESGIAKLFEALEGNDAYARDAALTALTALDLSPAEHQRLRENVVEADSRNFPTQAESGLASAASASGLG